MVSYYENNLGVTFDTKHSFRDFELYPVTRFYVSPPEPKTNYVEIAGADGTLDLTQALSTVIRFNDRNYEQQFKLVCDRVYWAQRLSDIMNYLQGRDIQFISDEDPLYFYSGRLYVSAYEHSNKAMYVTISGQIEPYKYELYSSIERWEWDPFNFETGIMRDYADIEVDNETITVYGSVKAVVPAFIVTDSDELVLKSVNGETLNVDMDDGQHIYPEVEIINGINVLEFEGSGTVSIDFRGASL